MLALIGDFKFDINGTNFEEYDSKLTFGFATHENIGDFNDYQSTGKWEQSDTISGTLICKSQKELDDFEDMAKKKLPVTLAKANGKAYTIIILSIEEKRNTFLKGGEFTRQDYTIQLQRVGE
jgi:phage protein U